MAVDIEGTDGDLDQVAALGLIYPSWGWVAHIEAGWHADPRLYRHNLSVVRVHDLADRQLIQALGKASSDEKAMEIIAAHGVHILDKFMGAATNIYT